MQAPKGAARCKHGTVFVFIFRETDEQENTLLPCNGLDQCSLFSTPSFFFFFAMEATTKRKKRKRKNILYLERERDGNVIFFLLVLLYKYIHIYICMYDRYCGCCKKKKRQKHQKKKKTPPRIATKEFYVFNYIPSLGEMRAWGVGIRKGGGVGGGGELLQIKSQGRRR